MKMMINAILSVEIGVLVIANLAVKGYVGWALFLGIVNFIVAFVLLEVLGEGR